ncbi:hypothetical protein BC834DRAFT_971840 [Gloeopeniophorella convolvens]|nr:hypothetical protein BC834DRAFT_971840 [Gloeopeniophorella convolvens]
MPSSGPVRISIGAWCRVTALQSMKIISDTILSGKVKVMIAGGFDHLQLATGRELTGVSRPSTITRGGFVESQDIGVHIGMSAKAALELGCPTRGILAFTSTSTDKASRSIPALGRGALRVTCEVQSEHVSPALNIGCHACLITFRRKLISD